MTTLSELEKQHAVIESGESDTLTNFYDWLAEQGYEITEWDDDQREYRPISLRPEQLFADFFGIDLDKIETERRAILETLRGAQ